MSYLNRAGDTDDAFDSLMEGLRREIEIEFVKNKLTSNSLTFLICGFKYDKSTEPVCLNISNLDESGKPSSRFVINRRTLDEDGVIVQIEGWTPAVEPGTRASIKKIAKSESRDQHALRKAVLSLQKASKHKDAMKTIGMNCNSAVIDARVDTTIVTTYHVGKADRTVYGPNSVVTKGMYSYGPMLRGEDLLTGPEIKKRDPCWCGSGLLFKSCHMRKFGSSYIKLPGFNRPLTYVSRISFDDPRPSGKSFCVAGGFA
ncbi:MAG TPA: hypothetical protein DER67_04360 [Novosphingobium sp.]|nr:hypothetical protein [Novosphingobium sp.]